MAEASHDDAALLRRFQHDRDETAFGDLVRRHGPLVWGVCGRRLERLEDAEDAFQTTFLILAIKSGTIRRPEALASWLHRTATRVARRVETRLPHSNGEESDSGGLDALAEVTRREMVAAVDDELQAIPGHYRDALVLFHLEGRPRREVARLLGLSEPTVKARLTRGRSLLRSRLARRGVALPLLLPLATDPLPAGAAESATRLGTTFGRTRLTSGDLLTTTLSQGANPMLSLITGKAGLAALAVCVGLAVAWVVKEPARAEDGEGKGEPVIDTTLETPERNNERLVAMLDKGNESAGGDKQESGDEDDSGKSEKSAETTERQPAQSIRFSPAERKIFETLSEPTKLEFTGIPLRDALMSLASQHDINIVIDVASIEEHGLSVDNNVDLFLNDITLESALNLMLEREGLAYDVEDEVLRITARDALKERLATRAYYLPESTNSEAQDDLAERVSGLLMAERRQHLFREKEPGKHPMDREPKRPAPEAAAPVIEIFDDRLLIAGPLEDHKNVQEILRLIYADPKATGNE